MPTSLPIPVRVELHRTLPNAGSRPQFVVVGEGRGAVFLKPEQGPEMVEPVEWWLARRGPTRKQWEWLERVPASGV